MKALFIVLIIALASCAGIGIEPVPADSPEIAQRIRFHVANTDDRMIIPVDSVELRIWYFTDELDPDELEGLQSGRSDYANNPDQTQLFTYTHGLTQNEFKTLFPSGNLIVNWRLLSGIRRVGENRYNSRWRSYKISPDFPPMNWVLITDKFRAGL